MDELAPFHLDGELGLFSDADWGTSQISDRRSISGYTAFFANGPVSWGSRKQPTVALSESTMEAELMALTAPAAPHASCLPDMSPDVSGGCVRWGDVAAF
jgi:hypothetical protein